MSDCSVQDVLTGAMSLLGDPSGEISQEIIDDFNTAYSEMVDLAIKCQVQQIKREVYYTLPANTNVLFPDQQLGVTDFDEPARLWERSIGSTIAVQSTTDGTPIQVNATAHGFNSGQRVELNSILGVPAWVNRDWYITVLNPNAFTLNGSILAGANGTGGTAMYSADNFVPMKLVSTIPSNQNPQNIALGVYYFEDNILYFPGSLEARQLWIEYYAGEDPPPSGIIGFANGRELNFLKNATAAHFAPKRQIAQGAQCRMDAYGDSGIADGGGGMLRALIVPMMHQKNARTMKPRPYRPRRPQFPTYL
jgi:hypothetical protein